MIEQATASQPARGGQHVLPADDSARSRQALVLAIFMIVTILPIKPLIGGQRMDPERLFLILTFLPFLMRILRGRAGRVTMVDGLMGGFIGWMMISFLVVHGTSQLSYAISQAIELLGGYMAGRVIIRSVTDYRRFIRYFLIVLAVFVPFGIIENITARMMLAEIFGHAFPVPFKVMDFRYGLARAQVVFAHPILYGLFCSLALASVYYIYRRHVFRLVAYVGLVIGATLLALSSAPMLSVLMQIGLIAWEKVTRGAWKVLAGLVAFVILILQLFSNRGPVIYFIENLTLDPQTGWWRVYIWTWGTYNVGQHKLFGLGLNDWVRPTWMYSASVDNFWLLITMRHGLPAIILLLGAFLLHIAYLIRARGLSPETGDIRRGYAMTMVGLCFVLSTVHIWDEVAVFVFFFLGAGSFFYNARMTPAPIEAQTEPANPRHRASLPFTRQAQLRNRPGSSPAPLPYARKPRT